MATVQIIQQKITAQEQRIKELEERRRLKESIIYNSEDKARKIRASASLQQIQADIQEAQRRIAYEKQNLKRAQSGQPTRDYSEDKPERVKPKRQLETGTTTQSIKEASINRNTQQEAYRAYAQQNARDRLLNYVPGQNPLQSNEPNYSPLNYSPYIPGDEPRATTTIAGAGRARRKQNREQTKEERRQFIEQRAENIAEREKRVEERYQDQLSKFGAQGLNIGPDDSKGAQFGKFTGQAAFLGTFGFINMAEFGTMAVDKGLFRYQLESNKDALTPEQTQALKDTRQEATTELASSFALFKPSPYTGEWEFNPQAGANYVTAGVGALMAAAGKKGSRNKPPATEDPSGFKVTQKGVRYSEGVDTPRAPDISPQLTTEVTYNAPLKGFFNKLRGKTAEVTQTTQPDGTIKIVTEVDGQTWTRTQVPGEKTSLIQRAENGRVTYEGTDKPITNPDTNLNTFKLQEGAEKRTQSQTAPNSIKQELTTADTFQGNIEVNGQRYIGILEERQQRTVTQQASDSVSVTRLFEVDYSNPTPGRLLDFNPEALTLYSKEFLAEIEKTRNTRQSMVGKPKTTKANLQVAEQGQPTSSGGFTSKNQGPLRSQVNMETGDVSAIQKQTVTQKPQVATQELLAINREGTFVLDNTKGQSPFNLFESEGPKAPRTSSNDAPFIDPPETPPKSQTQTKTNTGRTGSSTKTKTAQTSTVTVEPITAADLSGVKTGGPITVNNYRGTSYQPTPFALFDLDREIRTPSAATSLEYGQASQTKPRQDPILSNPARTELKANTTPLVDQNTGQGGGQRRATDEKEDQDQRQRDDVITDPDEREDQRTDPVEEVDEIIKVDPIEDISEQIKQTTAPPFFNMGKLKPDIIIPPPRGGFIPRPTGGQRTQRFKAQIRRRGMFKTIGVFSTKERAFSAALGKTRRTAAATARVTTTDDKPVRPIFTPRGFYKKGFNLIQKRGQRIKTAGEKKEITLKGIKATRSKIKFKGIFGGGK